MTVDTAALEQLLKRFEALRGCGLIKLLAVEQPATSCHPRELPPGCAQFASSAVTTSSQYGTAEGTGQRVYSFRWLGPRESVEEVLSATEAAGQLLFVPLAQAGLIHPADFMLSRDLANRCAFIVAMLSAAEGGKLPADGMRRGGWHHWVPGEPFAMSARAVDFHRGTAAPSVPLPFLPSPEALAAAVDTSARYCIIPNVVECCVGLLRVLALMKPAAAKVAKPPRPKKPFPNITECIKHIYSTAGGREHIAACGTLREVCDFIKQEYPGQRATPPLVKEGWPDGILYPFTKKRKQHTRTVSTASRMGEHFDIESFQERSPQPSARATASLKCASCRDAILNADDCLQHEGKLYCRECGEEHAHGLIPPLR